MKNKWGFYAFIRGIFRVYNRVYFRNFRVIGAENIPTNGGVLFSPNHQNAIVDPLMVGTTCNHDLHSLTRADVFDGPLRPLLSLMHTLPVYRIRDGYQQLSRNTATFDHCRALLGQKESLLMFSEGLHHEEYFLRRLSKGSSRLAMEAQKEHPNIPIYLQPVGLNYGHPRHPFTDVVVVYGEAFSLQSYLPDYDQAPAKTINAVRDRLQKAMEDCLWLPIDSPQYKEKEALINRRNTSLPFETLKKALQQEHNNLRPPLKKGILQQLLIVIFSIPNLPIHVFLWLIRKQFTDVVFHGTVNYAGHLLFFPIWWALGAMGYGSEGNVFWAMGFICLGIGFFYLRQKTINKYL